MLDVVLKSSQAHDKRISSEFVETSTESCLTA
jgi:hypothetical protein